MDAYTAGFIAGVAVGLILVAAVGLACYIGRDAYPTIAPILPEQFPAPNVSPRPETMNALHAALSTRADMAKACEPASDPAAAAYTWGYCVKHALRFPGVDCPRCLTAVLRAARSKNKCLTSRN